MHRASPVALFCIFLPAAILPAAERIRFAGPLTIRDVLREPVTVHTGDFDVDGKLDLVCSNGSGTVSVLLQDPLDRETWKEFEVRVGSSSYFTRGGDFDGDGASDLVVADGASTAYYLRSQGDGTFERPVPIIQARGPRWPATGDWNGDGRLDLATANLATSTLTIFVNEATPEGVPRFRMTQPSPLGRPHALEALDFDGDGVLDLVAGMGSVGIELHRGNGDGTFTFTPSNVGEIGCAQHVSVGDFNADGQDDLAPTCRDDGTAYVGISNGDGRYTRTLSAPFAPGTESSAAADLTRDGKDDLVLASESSPRLRVHPSLGDGTFGPPVEFGPIGDEPLFVIAADLDADGLHDVVSADSGGSTITVFIGGEGERFLESEDTITGVTSARGFDVGDFDRDGVPDVFLGDAALPRAYIYLEPGGRSPMAPSMVSDLAHRYRNIAVADLNGDGVPDLAGTSFELDSVVIALLDAQGRAHGELEIPGGPFQATAVGRIDPGPTLDLAVPVTTANEISIFPGTGDGRFEPVRTVPTIDRPRSVTLGDVNGDGRTDLAVLQTQLAAVHLQKEDGTFEPPATVLADSTVELTDVAVADLDGDGFGDVVLSDEETQAALVFPGRADGGLGEMIPIPLGVPALAIHLADVDGDGRIDVTASSAAAQSVAIAYNLGSGRFEPVSLEPVGVTPTAHRILDMNADGVSDILAFASTSAAVRLGSRAGAVLPFRRGDANDDGRVDITDGVYTLNFLFVGGAEPPCLEAANANDDAELDLTDAIHVLRFLFLSGPPPLPPGPESCGPDPAVSPGGLGCSAHGSCP